MHNFESLEAGFVSGIILMAIIHGALLISIFLFSNHFKTKSNRFLALAIAGISVILMYEFINWLDLEMVIPSWIQYLPLYIRSSIPVGLYYFVLFLLNPKLKLSSYDKMGYKLITLEFLIEFLYLPVNVFLVESEMISNIENGLMIVGWLMGVVSVLLFVPKAFLKIKEYQKRLYDNYSTTNDKSLGWLRNIFIVVICISTFMILSFVQYVCGYTFESEISFIIVTCGLVVVLFVLSYSVILRNEWFQVVEFAKHSEDSSNKGNKLSEKTNEYHKNLIKLIEKERLFENPDLTLDDLSQRLKLSSSYLSQIINEKEEKNFFEFINTYRVHEVKRKLLDEEYSHYTIMGIALESGFKSKSTFNAVFKKISGSTPSTFKRTNQ